MIMRVRFLLPAGLLTFASGAFAQAPGPADAPAAPPAAPVAPAAPAPPNTIVTQGPGGSVIVAPSGPDPNAGLPSGSRPKVGNETDSFDFRTGGGGSAVVSNPGGSAVISESGDKIRGLTPPAIHLVKRGDTLWDLGDTYYGNPWQWPRIWSYNPQIENPHWIYPGDQIRMQPGDGRGGGPMVARQGKGPGLGGKGGSGLVDRRQQLTRGTVVLRDQGFIGDPDSDVWGEVAGANEEQMLLAEGNHVYLLLKPGKTPRVGEELTVFRAVRQPDAVPGARKPPGQLVAVLGTVKVDSVDAQKNVARARITESLDVIERGARIGPVRRKFPVVPPLPAEKNVSARVLTSLYPLVYMAQNQVIFLDRGSEDGLRPGNRLVVMRRGDTWRSSLTARMTGDRMRTDVPENGQVERTPLPGENRNFPAEQVAELRVLTTERYSSLAIVVSSTRELVPGDVAFARAGM
jgi:hypothetical protein